jgi:hypothetical protein
VGKPEGRRPLGEDLGVDERMILKWIVRRYVGFVWLRIGIHVGHHKMRGIS